MRQSLLKLTGLMLALMILLTGCNLIGVDALKQLDVDFAKLTKEYDEAVAVEYDGGKLTKGDVLGGFVSTYSYYAQMYQAFGMQLNSATIDSVRQQSLETAMQSVAIEKQIASRGLSLTEEKLAEVQAAADENYNQAYQSFYDNTTGKDEAVRARQAEYDLYTNGFSKDIFYKSQLQQANYDLISETVRAEVELTDDQLAEAYKEKVAEDKEEFSENAGSFESHMSSDDEVVAWIPEGYRTVKHILVKPADDVLKAVTDARSALTKAEGDLEDLEDELDALNDTDPEADAEAEEAAEAAEEAEDAVESDEADADAADAEAEPTEAPRTAEQINADIENARKALETAKADVAAAEAACLESVKDKTDAIYSRIEAGDDFAALIAEYGEDPGMKNEPTATRGYYVAANSENWDANFTAGAMSLANVGDVTQTPLVSSSGVHIIRYESDATSGEVPLEEVRDKFYKETLEAKQDEHFDSELTAWVEALKPVYHPEVLTLD
ncbi:MAG: peptidylprolyl isomerase [Clostridia bacterium]|nr:peptidylprolyl isomerase [Clostridia bacterium]